MGTKKDRSADEINELRSLVNQQAKTIEELRQQIEILKNAEHGPTSEKRSRDWREGLTGLTGILPFPELKEIERELEKARQAEEEARKQRRANAGKRKKRGPRSDFPDHLPRLIDERSVPVEERYCCGHERHSMGFDETKRLERISTAYVAVFRREKLAPCAHCGEGGILTASAPAPVIEGGLLGPSMLAWTISQHFAHHLPYYRLEQLLRGEGLDLSRSVLCNSAVRCGELLSPVVRVVEDYVQSRDLIQVDDTGVVVRNGPLPGRENWHIWAYRALDGPVFYRITERRCQDALRDVIADFRGYVQADACNVYDFLFTEEEVRTEVGCWAHMRRGFVKARETDPELANEALDLIGAVYEIERSGKRNDLTGDALKELRHTRSRPLVDGIRSWCELTLPKVLPKGPLGRAIQYAINHWAALTAFVDNPVIREIDNNGCESALRAVAVGRKNWLFVGDQQAGPSNVNLMTLVNTCKALGVDPEHYFADVLVRLNETPASQVERLAPMHWRNDPDAQARVKSRRAQAMAALTRVQQQVLS